MLKDIGGNVIMGKIYNDADDKNVSSRTYYMKAAPSSSSGNVLYIDEECTKTVYSIPKELDECIENVKKGLAVIVNVAPSSSCTGSVYRILSYDKANNALSFISNSSICIVKVGP